MNYVSTKEIAEEFGINECTVRRMINDGKIKAIKLGRNWKITKEEFERLKEHGTKK